MRLWRALLLTVVVAFCAANLLAGPRVIIHDPEAPFPVDSADGYWPEPPCRASSFVVPENPVLNKGGTFAAGPSLS